MIKLIPTLLILSVLSACKKEYTCECRTETGSFIASYKLKEKEQKAKEKCKSTQLSESGLWEASCEIK